MYVGWFILQILLVRQDQKLKIIIIYIFVGSWAKKKKRKRNRHLWILEKKEKTIEGSST